MDKFTAEQINNAFAILSPLVSQAIYDIDMDTKIAEVSKKIGLDDLKSKDLNYYITLVVIELLNHDDFIKQITSEFQLSETNILEINSIFKTIDIQIQKIENDEEFLKQNASTIPNSQTSNEKIINNYEPTSLSDKLGIRNEIPKEKLESMEDLPLPPYKATVDIDPIPAPPIIPKIEPRVIQNSSIKMDPEFKFISDVETKPFEAIQDITKQTKNDVTILAQKLSNPTLVNATVSNQPTPAVPDVIKPITPNPSPSQASGHPDQYREELV